ncbi:MAG: hypothetical protein WBM32_13255 [Crocosphaera sp.]
MAALAILAEPKTAVVATPATVRDVKAILSQCRQNTPSVYTVGMNDDQQIN